MENNIKVKVKKIFDKIVINRSCSEYEITINLDKAKDTISYYTVFGGSKKFELATHVKKMIVTDKMINVQYELESNDYKFKLEET